MIIEKKSEILENVRGTARINLDDICGRADEMALHWEDVKVYHEDTFPLELTDDCKLSYGTRFHRYSQDISEYGFSQLCSKVGIPAAYTKKCFDSGKEDLALENYREWAKDKKPEDNDYLIRSYNGVAEAVLTDKYNVFGSNIVLNAVRDAVTDPKYAGRYEANQIYLSQDRLHVRFVDFNTKLNIGDPSPVYPGFVVQSSDVGAAALSIKFFLYRFACRNGIVYVKHGGVLFRQTHLGTFTDNGKGLFMEALGKIDNLNEIVTANINEASKKRLTEEEFEMYLNKAQKELHFGKSGAEKLKEIIETSYDRSLWGVINGVTENAQNNTRLDRRIEAEMWAGNMLAKAV